ncbi:extracellular solute-binding protein [Paenibacillus sp. WST5]|uniref:Extracellular solute-binding protein n=2 Tax=Paenibacillus sedimenti TaxID=2770274 RepID=A0A926QJR1_9BACL|nr:extracellular solute-binding protein [Paenibacillus sedimenti]
MPLNTGRRKASLSLLLVGLLTSGLLSGCIGSAQSSVRQEESTGGRGYEEPVTLKVQVYERGLSPSGVTVTNNYLTDWVQRQFGDPNHIRMKYVPVPRARDIQELNVMIASGEAPDIVFTYDENLMYSYASQGGLQELGALLDTYGPNLKSFLGKETLDFGLFEGQLVAIPAKRSYVGKYSSYIREDWLNKLGLPAPQTTEEVYQTLKAFKDKLPGIIGEQVIPLGFSLTPASYEPIVWSFIEPMDEEERITLTHQLGSRDFPTLLPGHKEALRFLNKLYNEGLMSPNFALDKDRTKLNQDISAGAVGLFSADTVNPLLTSTGIYSQLQRNVPGALLSPIDPYTNSRGKHNKPVYKPAGMYIMISKSSKRTVEAVKYLDWMSRKDVLLRLQNGEEGLDYNMQDGIPAALENEETKKRMFNSGDIAIISNGRDFGDPEKNKRAEAMNVLEPYREEASKVLDIALQDGILPVRFDKPVEAQIRYGTALFGKYEELVVRSIMARPSDFDRIYEQALNEIMKGGGEQILKERQTLYKAMQMKRPDRRNHGTGSEGL